MPNSYKDLERESTGATLFITDVIGQQWQLQQGKTNSKINYLLKKQGEPETTIVLSSEAKDLSYDLIIDKLSKNGHGQKQDYSEKSLLNKGGPLFKEAQLQTELGDLAPIINAGGKMTPVQFNLYHIDFSKDIYSVDMTLAESFLMSTSGITSPDFLEPMRFTTKELTTIITNKDGFDAAAKIAKSNHPKIISKVNEQAKQNMKSSEHTHDPFKAVMQAERIGFTPTNKYNPTTELLGTFTEELKEQKNTPPNALLKEFYEHYKATEPFIILTEEKLKGLMKEDFGSEWNTRVALAYHQLKAGTLVGDAEPFKTLSVPAAIKIKEIFELDDDSINDLKTETGDRHLLGQVSEKLNNLSRANNTILQNKEKQAQGLAKIYQFFNSSPFQKYVLLPILLLALFPLSLLPAFIVNRKVKQNRQVLDDLKLRVNQADEIINEKLSGITELQTTVNEQIQAGEIARKTSSQEQIPEEIAEKIWEQSGLSIEILNTNAYWSVVPSEKITQSSQLFISSEDLKMLSSNASVELKEKLEKLIDLHLEVMQVDSEKVGNGKTLDHTKVISVSADEYVRNLSLVLDAGITDAKIAHDVALSVIKKLEQPDPEATVNMINSAQTLLSIHLAKQIAPQDRELMLLILESKRNEVDAETICNKLIALKKQKDGGETVDKKTILNEIETALIGKSKTLKTKRNQVAPGPNITVVPKHSTTGVKAVSVGQGNPGQKQNLQDPSSKTPRSTFGKNQP